MKDMYLVPKNYGGGYRVVMIQKTNTKSYTLSDSSRMDIDLFHEVAYKLTEEEKAIFKGELVMNLVNTAGHVNRLNNQLSKLQSALNSSDFVTLDTSKLQQEIDKFTEDLTNLVKPFKINDKYFKFVYNYSSDMEEVRY